MKFLMWLSDKLSDAFATAPFEPQVLDDTKDYRKRIAKARERHGKTFRAHLKVSRTEPKSRDLIEIEQAAKPSANREEAARVVRPMRKERP